MCFFDSNTLELNMLKTAWLKHDLPGQVSERDSSIISQLIDWLLEPCLNFVTEKCVQFVKCSKMHLTFSFLRLLKCLLTDMM